MCVLKRARPLPLPLLISLHPRRPTADSTIQSLVAREEFLAVTKRADSGVDWEENNSRFWNELHLIALITRTRGLYHSLPGERRSGPSPSLSFLLSLQPPPPSLSTPSLYSFVSTDFQSSRLPLSYFLSAVWLIFYHLTPPKEVFHACEGSSRLRRLSSRGFFLGSSAASPPINIRRGKKFSLPLDVFSWETPPSGRSETKRRKKILVYMRMTILAYTYSRNERFNGWRLVYLYYHLP